MNESCHVWMSFGMRMNQPCRPYEWFMSHIHEPTTSHFTYEFVIWHSCARHIMHADESCHTCEQVMLRICNGHVTRMEKSCHTHERVMSHMQTQSNINSCDTYATYCNTLRRDAQHSAIHCNALQHSAAHCDTLQHTQAHSYRSCSNPFRDLQSKPLTLQHTHAGSKLPQLFKPFLRSSVEATVKQYKNYLSSKLMSVSDEQNTKTQQTHTHTHTYGNR